MYWGIAVTHPQSEKKAIGHLERQGFECYAPRFREIGVVAGRKVERSAFLFPRYVFVFIQDGWYEIKSTIGVAALLVNNMSVPAKVPEGVLGELKGREDSDGFIQLPHWGRKIGDRVEIKDGQFKGLRGIYKGMTSRQREVVLLDALGKVELAATDL